jgi:hypothetical protein
VGVIGGHAETSTNTPRDLDPGDNIISIHSKASDPPTNPDTELSSFKGPRLSLEQNLHAATRTTSPMSADADELRVIPMTVSKMKEEGNTVITDEPGGVTPGHPSPTIGKYRHHNKPFAVSSHSEESYNYTADYSNLRQPPFQLPRQGSSVQPVSLISCLISSLVISLSRSFTLSIPTKERSMPML